MWQKWHCRIPAQSFKIPCNFCFYLLGTVISLPWKKALIQSSKWGATIWTGLTEENWPLNEYQGPRHGGESISNILAPVESPQPLTCGIKLHPLGLAQIPDPPIISNNTLGSSLKPLSFRTACYMQCRFPGSSVVKRACLQCSKPQLYTTGDRSTGERDRPVWILKISQLFQFWKNIFEYS